MAFARERALIDHLADDHQELLVGQLRPRSAFGEGDHNPGVVTHGGRLARVDRRARRVQDIAHSLAGHAQLHGYLGRFLGGI